MRIAVAQINPTLGDFQKNRLKILEYINRAKERKCELVIFPEAALFGYHPFDLLEREKIVEDQLKELSRIEKEIPMDITAIVGVITKNSQKRGRPYFNSAAIVQKKKKTRFFHKQLLPTGDVFDEARFIESGDLSKNVITILRKKVLITICEDIWAWEDQTKKSLYKKNPLLDVKGKIDLVVNLSASPFSLNKMKKRKDLVQKTAKYFKAPTFYVNLVGAQDEIVFDGGSFAVSKKGSTLLNCCQFEEDLNVCDMKSELSESRSQKLSRAEEIRQALVLGIRDFCDKTGLQKVHLGLSGGIDSAVVACLAVDALGPGRVCGIAMPGPYSADLSLLLAQELARNLGIQSIKIEINNIYELIKESLDAGYGTSDFSIMHENLQARIRGLLLMAYSNKNNSLLLSTSNKSEFATGYTTLYGDMCGGLAPIGDLTKHQVYELAYLYNQQRNLIPEQINTRAPSAELRENQKDQDTLPDYKKLDAAVDRIVENCRPAKTPEENWLLSTLMRTEFKRWQAAPILKITKHAFGRGRRYPIAHKAKPL